MIPNKLIVLILMAVLSFPALAADGGAGQMDAQSMEQAAHNADKSENSAIGMLRYLFGSVVNNPLSPSSTEGTSTVLGEIFAVLNAGLLAIGALFVGYNVIAGVAQTAQDGEFLGKRFNSLWVPFRVLTGVVSLVPIFKGWSLAQLIMIWFSVMGVGLANLGTTAVVKYLKTGGSLSVARPTSESQKFVAELYRINLCMSSLNAESSGGYAKSTVQHDGGTSYFYGRNGDSTCGEVWMPGTTRGNAEYKASAIAANKAYNDIDSKVREATNRFVKSIKDSHAASGGGGSSGQSRAGLIEYGDNDVMRLAQEYTRLLAATKAATRKASHKDQVFSVMERSVDEMGFVALGAWYSTIASVSTEVGAAMDVQASVIKSAPDPGNPAFSGSMGDEYRGALAIMNGRADRGKSENKDASMPGDENALVQQATKKMKGSLCGNENMASATAQGSGPFGVGSGGQGLLGLVLRCSTNSDRSALLRMKNTGDYVSALGFTGMTTAFFIQGAAKGAENAAQSAGPFSAITSLLSGPLVGVIVGYSEMLAYMMKVMVFFGMMLSTYLPLLPYIAWLGAILSWLTVVVESVVASPLWAFAHLDTDGEGMGRRTEHGYVFILNVLFRPILMVTGFMLAALMMDVIGGFFFSTYLHAVGSAQADSMTGLFAIVFYVAIFFTTAVMIVNLSVNLIHYVPDSVLGWIGKGDHDRGVKEATGNFTAATAAASHAGQNMASSGFARVAQKANEKAQSLRARSSGEMQASQHQELVQALSGKMPGSPGQNGNGAQKNSGNDNPNG